MLDRLRPFDPWLPVVYSAALVVAYAPVFGAGFLSYDDPWLYQSNPFYAPFRWDTPWHVLFDFSFQTRLALGAEYLPLRDLLGWLQVSLLQLPPQAMHAVSLALYGGSVLLLRSALRTVLGPGLVAELSALLFALHPIHVESVAWLAGQKDVLALLFITAALRAHAQASSTAWRAVPLLVLAACLSKAMSLSVLILLGAQDVYLRRRPDRRLYVLTTAVIVIALGLHLYTGRVVFMISEPAGGSRYTALITMGPVWLRYALQTAFPLNLSVIYYVPDLLRWNAAAAAGYAFLVLTLLASIALATRGHRFALLTWLWFIAPLLPVSQVGAPLQNRMADRYAWLSVLAPCMLTAQLLRHGFALASTPLLRLIPMALTTALVCGLAWLTFQRSLLFGDAVWLFSDAALKSPDDPKPAYHLARVLGEAGREHEAILAFRQALARPGSPRARERRNAANGLATLLAKHGELAAAEQVLREALQKFPGEPKVTRNLGKLLRASNRTQEAEALERNLPPAAADVSAP